MGVKKGIAIYRKNSLVTIPSLRLFFLKTENCTEIGQAIEELTGLPKSTILLSPERLQILGVVKDSKRKSEKRVIYQSRTVR
jgi:hypothetical protein